MKRSGLALVLLIITFCSCQNNDVKLIADGPKFAINKGKKETLDFSNSESGQPSPGADLKAGALNSSFNGDKVNAAKKAEEAKTGELPHFYKMRDFMNTVSDSAYNVFTIPGNIVEYNPKDSTYKLKTLNAVIKGNKSPLVTAINDGILYSGNINSNCSFNGTFMIGGLNAGKGQILELNIQDAARSFVPDSLIDKDMIKHIAGQLPPEDRKNYYYVKGVILTLIDNRKYIEAKFDAGANSSFITASGKTYSSNEKFQRKRVISIIKVPLDNLINDKP